MNSPNESIAPCIPKMSVVWRRLPSLPYRRRPVGPAGEERGPSTLSTRRVPFVAPQAGSLHHSRQGCLRDHDNPANDNLWRHRLRPAVVRFYPRRHPKAVSAEASRSRGNPTTLEKEPSMEWTMASPCSWRA